MRIIFMGTPEIARKSLQRLYDEGYEIAAVFTGYDKPSGRGMSLSSSPVKQLAAQRGTQVYHPGDLNAETVSGLNPDLIAVVAFGKILKREILQIPPKGCINIHGSILPKYRGAAPIQYAVLNGETHTGVTSMYMSEEMDAGDIIYISETDIHPNETSGDLFERLGDMGAELLTKTIAAIKAGDAPRKAQNHSDATFAPMLTRDMSPIDFSCSARAVKCKIQALIPWPVATMMYAGTLIKVYKAEITDKKTGQKPGTILDYNPTSKGIEVVCKDGTVIITRLQAPGKKIMAAADYLRGLRIK